MAENLENLQMKYGNKILSYNVEFLCYSSLLNWGDSVLVHRYYKGLPNQLQDQISLRKAGKPGTFQEMMRVATTYDDRHWERERERARVRSDHPAPSSDKSRKGQQQQQQQPNNSRSSTSQQSSGNKPNQQSTPQSSPNNCQII